METIGVLWPDVTSIDVGKRQTGICIPRFTTLKSSLKICMQSVVCLLIAICTVTHENKMFLCMDATISTGRRSAEFFLWCSPKLASFLIFHPVVLVYRNQKSRLRVLVYTKNLRVAQIYLPWKVRSQELILDNTKVLICKQLILRKWEETFVEPF